MSKEPSEVALEAKEIATDAKYAISAHERECSLRYLQIQKDVSEIKDSFKFIRRAIIGAVIAIPFGAIGTIITIFIKGVS